MYGGRYGIWGIDPYGVDVMGKALQTSQGLGMNQARMLQNQGLQMQNDYEPQNQAINLADAALRQQQLQQQQSRFGPLYGLSKMINTLPAEAKLNIASENPELYAAAISQANQDYLNPRQQNNSAGMGILQPFLNRQMGGQSPGMGYQPQSQFNSTTGMGAQSNVNPQQPGMGQPAPSAPDAQDMGGSAPPNQNASGVPAPSNSSLTNTIQKAGKEGYDKKIRNVDQQKRIDAGGRFEIAMKNINEKLPLVSQYVGPFGKLKLQTDKLAAGANNKGIVSAPYQAYLDIIPAMEIAKGDLSVILGKRSTDNAMKEISEVMKYDNFFSNPQAAISKIQNTMGIIEKTIENNKLTTHGQLSQPKASLKIPEKSGANAAGPTGSKSGWGGDGKSYTHDGGKSYTLEELQKIAKGGKK